MLNQKSGSAGARLGKTSFFSRTSKRSTHISKDEKQRFFENGILPKFKGIKSEKYLQKKNASIDNELLPEALRILNKVRDQFGNDGRFIEAAYGKRISANRASEVIHNYLVEHGIDGMMTVYFSTELDCSGKMTWTGPMNKYNLPEKRNYSMWVKNTLDNMYLRETGILSLSNHEIGTHFLRSFNDGLQPWYANRSLFGIGPYKSQALKDTEEGFASVNTTFEAKVKYLWGPAILYYTACMSLKMNFKDLFDDLTKFVADPEVRWKYVFRVKRGRTPAQLGGNGKDQCYFRGAMHILTNMDSIDFNLLYAGKITVEDQHRVQRLARLGCVKTPYFLKDMQNYKRHLRTLIKVNGVNKPKTTMIKQPQIKTTPTKATEYGKKHDYFPLKKQQKKEVKNLVMESRKRILSHLEESSDTFLSVSETPDENCDQKSNTIVINPEENEHNHDTEDAISKTPNNDLLPPTKSETSFPSPILVREAPAEAESYCEKVPSLCFTNRRKSDTPFRFTNIDSKDEEIDDSRKTLADSAYRPTPQAARSYDPTTVSNLSSEVFSRGPHESDMVIIENDGFPIPFKSGLTTRQVMTPSGKRDSSLDTQARRSICEVKMDESVTVVKNTSPTSKKLVTPQRSILSSRGKKRSPSVLDPKTASNTRKPVKLSTEVHKENTAQQQKNVGKSEITSSTSATAKKSMKKKFSSFFDDLIPFSKSRKKRVLPLPVGK